MERDTFRVLSGPPHHTDSTIESQIYDSPEIATPDTPKYPAVTLMEDMSKSNTKEDSTWRRRLLKPNFTMLPNAHPEPRPFVNKYFFKRPRLLQYYDAGGVFVDSHGHRLGPSNPDDVVLSNTTTVSEGITPTPSFQTQAAAPHLVEESSDPETSKLQRDWLNLFIDLLWVGIVSNISSSFVTKAFAPASSWAYAFLEFMVLFLTAFRFWSYIRKFLNNYFRKDFLQSLFLTWVLVLALFFGNQTPYFLDEAGGKWIIATFLTAKGSFVAMEVFYSYFIPSLRREVLVTFLISIPVAVLWGGAVWLDWPARGALVLPAVIFEGIVSTIIALPVGDWFLRGAPKKALDPDNFVDRLQGFFIIVVGEGVYGLISGNDWGVGLNARAVFAIESLIIYYGLFSLYFTGDQTKTYIHAIYRNRYTSLAFHLFHILLFASMLVLDASIKYLIQNSVTSSGSLVLGPDMAHSVFLARWTISASLVATLLWMTLRSLLNRSLDTPGTLLVDNRYIRMVPRAVVSVIFLCLPAVENISPYTYLTVIMALLQSLILWELVAGMEKGAKLFETRQRV